jgi:hypothetical protein
MWQQRCRVTRGDYWIVQAALSALAQGRKRHKACLTVPGKPFFRGHNQGNDCCIARSPVKKVIAMDIATAPSPGYGKQPITSR